jgi:hypothetical protein
MSKRIPLNRKKKLDRQVYSEREYFSQRHAQWDRYHVKRPRLPTNNDKEVRWLDTKFQPKSIRLFLGTHNSEVSDIDSILLYEYHYYFLAGGQPNSS